MDLKLITYPNVSLETKIEKDWDFDNPPYDAVELKEARLKVKKDKLGTGRRAGEGGEKGGGLGPPPSRALETKKGNVKSNER